MKYLIALTVAITTFLLFITKSLYVEWNELIIIIASLSIISVLINVFLIKEKRDRLISSGFVAFLLFWVFALFDLTFDHFLYYLPTGNEDGMPLSLRMKIQEYSDDLVFGSFITVIAVMVISFIFTTILTQNKK